MGYGMEDKQLGNLHSRILRLWRAVMMLTTPHLKSMEKHIQLQRERMGYPPSGPGHYSVLQVCGTLETLAT
jgi:hypothetical protein